MAHLSSVFRSSPSQSRPDKDFDLADFLNLDDFASLPSAAYNPKDFPASSSSSSSQDPLFGTFKPLSFNSADTALLAPRSPLRADSPVVAAPNSPLLLATWSPSRVSAPSATPPLAPPSILPDLQPLAQPPHISPDVILQTLSLLSQRTNASSTSQPMELDPSSFNLNPQQLQTLNQLMTVAALSAAHNQLVTPTDLTGFGSQSQASSSQRSVSPESKDTKRSTPPKRPSMVRAPTAEDSSDSDPDSSTHLAARPSVLAPKKPASNSKHAPSKDHTTGEDVVIDKSLSSRERRQLRNKISARNFRLRRKEYITTLEDELKKVGDENSELKDRVGFLEQENSELRREVEALRGGTDVKPIVGDITRTKSKSETSSADVDLTSSQRNVLATLSLLQSLQTLQKPGLELPQQQHAMDAQTLLAMLNLAGTLPSPDASALLQQPTVPTYDPMDEDWMNRFNKDASTTSSSSSSSNSTAAGSKWANVDRRVRVHHFVIEGVRGIMKSKEEKDVEGQGKLIQGVRRASGDMKESEVIVRTAVLLGLLEMARRRGVKVVVE
ncbi:hypothetical protein BJ742DRAFT_814221 [Cladochytrium replicatum]|nr:hypothetical protein BJ742DRAFT_814221 [Cladochytrium replicatum]